MKTTIEKRTAALLTRAFQKLPARIRCPKCGRTRGREHFGLRTMEKGADGLPTRVAPSHGARSAAGRRSDDPTHLCGEISVV